MPEQLSVYKPMPKIDLHVHLDTSLSFRNVSNFLPGITEEEYNANYVAPEECKTLQHYLDFTTPALSLLQTAENLDAAIRQLVRELKEENIIYAEIRFAPLLHTKEGLDPEWIAEIACHAIANGYAETKVISKLLFCTMRHFTPTDSMATVKLAEKWKSKGVVGIDIAGDEASYSLDAHIPAFQYAQEAGLNVTVHAGEALGAESVLESLELLNPRRIGHGVRSAEDPEIVKLLARNRIHLEVCPTSNLQTGVYPSMQEHTLNNLYQAGVSLNINTDGRGLTNTTLTKEYDRVSETFGWKKADFLRTNRMALRAAFCDLPTKDLLLAALESGYIG